MENIIIETTYIQDCEILNSIYNRASSKFFDAAGERIVFNELVEYIKRQLAWKKQCLYSHGLPILKSVCQRIAEDFENGVDFAAPNAKCYRDIYYAVFE